MDLFKVVTLYMFFFILSGFVTGDVAINCGSAGNSGAFDGRQWVGDAACPELVLKGKSKSSTAVGVSFSADPVPYKTSRISATPFQYEFQVTAGQKFIRLHFYPAYYGGFRNSQDIFTVKAGPFTLLNDFSASLAAQTLEVDFLVKEFCLNIEQNSVLTISFSPSRRSSAPRKVVAFVNGIEVISMPTGLYYTKDGDMGARNGIVDDGEISQPYENGITESMQFSQSPSPARAKETQLREDSSSVKKPTWGSWITAWIRGKPKKLVSSNEGNPSLDSGIKKESSPDSGIKKESSPSTVSGPSFSILDIQAATNNFTNIELYVDECDLIRSYYAKESKAWLGYMERLGKQVTVYPDQYLDFGATLEFRREIEKLSRMRHVNLLGLCTGVAEGLAYLQKCTGRAKNHDNLRLANILMGRNYTPKISHFGLSGFKFLVEDTPQEARQSILPGLEMREDSDLSSFGLILVEVLLARRINVEEISTFLVATQKSFKRKTFHNTIDSTLKGEIAAACLVEYLKVMFSCIFVSKLPTSMDGVASALKAALQLQEQAEGKRGSDNAFSLERIYLDTSNLDVFLADI